MADGTHNSGQTMESSPLFDLNESIGRWRERLISLRSFDADDLEELENHLRESVAELQAGGLSLEEAFLVATERLGSDRRLAEEYAKTNSKRIWTGRATWMLGGVVAWKVMAALVEAGLRFVFSVSVGHGINARLIVVLDLLTQWTITMAFIGLGCWLMARRNRWLARTVTRCLQRPVWTGVVLVLGLMGLQILSVVVPHWWQQHIHRAATLAAADSTIFHTWGLSAMALNRLVWVAAIPFLATYLWKAAPTAAGSLPALRFESLQENERALAGRLEAEGLSRSESLLILARRRGYLPAPAEAGTRSVSGLWLERGFWMVVGMVANWMLRDFVEGSFWIQTRWDNSSSPLWQHVGGVVSMFLPLALVGAPIAVFWNGATGAQKRSGWMRWVFAQSPVRGAALFAALACVWIGLTAYFALVQPADPALHVLPHSRIGVIWWASKSFLTAYLLPVILLVWVGNRSLTGRESA